MPGRNPKGGDGVAFGVDNHREVFAAGQYFNFTGGADAVSTTERNARLFLVANVAERSAGSAFDNAPFDREFNFRHGFVNLMNGEGWADQTARLSGGRRR